MLFNTPFPSPHSSSNAFSKVCFTFSTLCPLSCHARNTDYHHQRNTYSNARFLSSKYPRPQFLHSLPIFEPNRLDIILDLRCPCLLRPYQHSRLIACRNLPAGLRPRHLPKITVGRSPSRETEDAARLRDVIHLLHNDTAILGQDRS